MVTLPDFNLLAGHFGGPGTFGDGDATFDGIVDLADFNLVVGRFGTSLSKPPEGANSLIVDAQPDITTLLQWTPPEEMTGILGYRIWRSTDGVNFGSQPYFTINDPSVTAWTDGLGTIDSGPPLQDATKYWYRLRAFTSAGNLMTTNKEWAVTILPAITDLSFYGVTHNTVTVSWTDNTVNETGFKLRRRVAGGTWGPEILLPKDTVEYIDPDVLTPNTQYEYELRAVTSIFSHESMPVSATVTTASAAAQPAPVVRARAVTGSRILVDWEAAPNAVGYRVERRRSDQSSWVNADAPQLGPTIRNIDDTGLTPDKTYLYRVVTIGADSSEALSAETSATTYPLTGGSVPARPTQVTATPQANQTVITWTPGAGGSANGYKVYRSKDGGLSQEIATLGPNEFSYPDTEVGTGAPEGGAGSGTYIWSVGAHNSYGTSDLHSSPVTPVGTPSGEWLWETSGEAFATGNAIRLGVPNRSEDDFQPRAQHAASLLLEPAASYTLRFEVDWNSWDTGVERFHNGTGQGLPNDGGFWDVFSISVTDQKYVEEPVANNAFPLNAPLH